MHLITESRHFPPTLALVAGALGVFGFAPFYFYPAPVLALAVLFWLQIRQPERAARLGWMFGFGLFGAGVSWIYVSLHDFGGMPGWMAVLATATFCGFMALFPACAGWLSKYFKVHLLLALPLLWVLLEWVRLWIFTGFPWLAIGYAQVPYSPLAGLAPVLGVYGVSLAAAVCAAVIAAKLDRRISGKQLGFTLLLFWLAGSALKHVEWTTPTGSPLSFSLLQGNVAQDLKWQENALQPTLQLYRQMALASQAQLIVLPETALPILPKHLPDDYLTSLAAHAKKLNGNILIGLPERSRDATETRYFNSAWSIGADPQQTYRKFHLVPFGEFIPFKQGLGWIYRDWLHIPLTDLSPGNKVQQPLQLSGQKVAVNICYEDAFGEEIIRQLPQATLLVNLSNDAWYGDAWFGRALAAHQHMQLSQTRALETGRMMLRATNTGATAMIQRDGHVVKLAPLFTRLSLEGEAQGYAGATPYVNWGNWPVITLILLALGLSWVRKKK